MARFLNARLPGVHVPQPLIDEMEAAADPGAAGVEIAARHIREVRGMSQGVHVMAIGWEARIPAILGAAGLSLPTQPSPIQEEGALERAWTEGGGL
jgi:5,10-methylenetetrahydrofolate reductase